MGDCQRCDGNGVCLQTTCNFECKYIGENSCETIVAGGGQGGGFAAPLSEEQRLTVAKFTQCWRVEQCSEAMLNQGLEPGDLVTHVNGKFPQSMDDFAELVKVMPKGTILKVWKQSGKRLDVEL